MRRLAALWSRHTSRIGLDQPRSLRLSADRQRKLRRRTAFLEQLEDRLALSTFAVLHTSDSGPDSLRQAILDANASAGTDTISFSIDPGSGVNTIRLLSPLPEVKDPVILDATTEPGFSGSPLIELDLSSAGVGASGLVISAGGSTVRGLVINRTGNHGILLVGAGGNRIEGNYVGTDPTGTLAIGNLNWYGVYVVSPNNIIGGTMPAARNVIGGYHAGIRLSEAGSGNVVQGNYAGVSASGTAAIRNNLGILIDAGARSNVIGGASLGAGNVVSGNSVGVLLRTGGNSLQGNYIGTDATGDVDLGNAVGILIEAAGTTIGGPTAGAGNVVSGNNGIGIDIRSSSNVIEGNLIGTNASGSGALGNSDNGITISGNGSSNVIARNVISANNIAGIQIVNAGSTGNLIQGNYIGTDITGTVNLGNAAEGVRITTANNTVGENTIAFNTGGIVITSTVTGNALVQNSIFSNGSLGVDLGNDGVTLNDVGDNDTGANNLQNFPLLVSSTSTASSGTEVNGSLNSKPNTEFTLEFFSNPTADPSGFGEGKTYFGRALVTTDDGGNASFSLVFAAITVPIGQFVTATATDPSGSTSEFSQAIGVAPGNRPPMANNDTFATKVDTPVILSVLTNDFDPDGDSLTIAAVGPALHGATATDGTTVTYIPAANYTGPDSFNYTVNDGLGGTSTATVNITVSPNPFGITSPTLGSTFFLGQDVSIQWTGGGPLGSVNLFLIERTPGLPFAVAAVVAAGIPNSGTFNWTFPATHPFGGPREHTYDFYVENVQRTSWTYGPFFTVAYDNDAPVAGGDSYNTNEDTTLTISVPGVLANDTDVDGDTLSAVLVSGPSNGSLTLNADGSFTYTPAPNFNGADTFSYQANDGELDSNVATVTITVHPVNDTPIGAADAFVTDEDTAVSGNVLGNDHDPDGDPVQVNGYYDAAHGTVVIYANGDFTYTPDANFNGSDSFVYELGDGHLLPDPLYWTSRDYVTVTITVNPVNDAPQVSGGFLGSGFQEGDFVTRIVGIVDPDLADTFTVIVDWDDPSAAADSTFAVGRFSSLLVGDQLASSSDDAVLRVIAVDAARGEAAFTVTHRYVDNRPGTNDLFTTAVTVMDEGGSSGTNLASTFITNVSPTVQLAGGGPINFASARNYSSGASPIGVAVGDFNGDSSGDLVVVNENSDNFAVLVNRGDGTFSNHSWPALSAHGTSVAAGDFNGDALLDLAVTTYSGLSVFLGNGNSTFQSSVDYSAGSLPVHVVAGDLNGDHHVDLVVVNQFSSDVSVFLNNGNGTFARDVRYGVGAGTSPLSVAVADFNGDSRPDLAVANQTINNVSVLLNNGNGTFQPAQAVPANSNPASVVAGDFNGDGKQDLAVANFSSGLVSVLLGNGTGTFQAPINYAIDARSRSVIVSDFNNDGRPDIAAGTLGTQGVSVLMGVGDGTFQASLNFSTSARPITIAAGDMNGDGKVDLVSANYNSGNASVLLNQTAGLAVNEGGTVTIAGTMTDPGPSDTHAVTINWGDGSPDTVLSLAAGALDIPATDHQYLDDNAADTYSIRITVTDDDAGVAAATLIVTVNNLAPTAASDAATVAEDSGATTIDVLANDTDPAGTRDPLTITTATNGTHGVVAVAADGKSLSYTPDADFFGTDSFSYTISDGDGGTATAIAMVIVTAVNDAPVGQDDSYNVDEDNVLSVPAPGVLANDSDPDGDPVRVNGFYSASHGAVRIWADGTFEYTSEANFHGTDSFVYELGDGHLLPDPLYWTSRDYRTVTIIVRAINDAPVAVDDTAFTNEDTSLTLSQADLKGNDTDGDNTVAQLTVTAVSGAIGGSVVLNVDGTTTFTPDSNFNGFAGFDYIVSDGSLDDAGHVTIVVNAVNDLPAATVILSSTAPRTNDVLTAAATADDVEGDPISLKYVWKVDGIVRQTRTITALTDTFDLNQPGYGDKGQRVSVAVTPSDDAAEGPLVSASATVVNSAPLALVILNTAAPGKHDILKASITPQDPDGDPLVVTYVWKINGVVARVLTTSALTSTLDLKAFHVKKDDVITVEVTPFDGFLDGPLVSAVAVVRNGPQ